MRQSSYIIEISFPILPISCFTTTVSGGGEGLSVGASFWPQPSYHGTAGPWGPINNFVVTHGDRARLSPVRSCAMTCTFCNVPYDDPINVYALKSPEAALSAVRTAVTDPLQPAHHLLISGGTPKPKDVGWLRELYARMLVELPDVPIDIMMVPLPELFDLRELAKLGLNELSINIELFNRERTREYARQKYNQGLNFYLDFIERASNELGIGRTRSMLMVGLRPRGHARRCTRYRRTGWHSGSEPVPT